MINKLINCAIHAIIPANILYFIKNYFAQSIEHNDTKCEIYHLSGENQELSLPRRTEKGQGRSQFSLCSVSIVEAMQID